MPSSRGWPTIGVLSYANDPQAFTKKGVGHSCFSLWKLDSVISISGMNWWETSDSLTRSTTARWLTLFSRMGIASWSQTFFIVGQGIILTGCKVSIDRQRKNSGSTDGFLELWKFRLLEPQVLKVTDILDRLISANLSYSDPRDLPRTCASYVVDLRRLQPFSPRLRHLLICYIGSTGYSRFEQVGSAGFFELLDHLHIRGEDVAGNEHRWGELLLTVLESTEGIRRLPYGYWELLAELIISKRYILGRANYDPRIAESLGEAEEWDKLQWWFCTAWASWGPNSYSSEVADVESMALPLFRNQPGACEKIERWMERLDRSELESFQRMCERANLGAVGLGTS